MADQYEDRPQVCPNCGNENVGHTEDADYCIFVPDKRIGCGWLYVHKPNVPEG